MTLLEKNVVSDHSIHSIYHTVYIRNEVSCLQIRCVSSCVAGTYQSILSNEGSMGELVGGTDICRPCDEVCAEYKNTTSLRMDQCIEACYTGKQQQVIRNTLL